MKKKKIKEVKKTSSEKLILAPQPGPQIKFLTTEADICIYGGSAGGGKTYALLLESLRHRNNPTLKCVIFRKTIEDAMGEGGIWSDTESIFPILGAKSNLQKKRWTFPDINKLNSKNKKAAKKEKLKPSGATISFAGLQYEKDKYKFQGRQIALIMFDELTHFTKSQFFYMLSRNRLGTGAYGIRPYVRGTCNPDPNSWVKNLIDWWLDDKGYPIPERSGIIRYFVRVGNNLEWFESLEDAKKEHPNKTPISFTFIPSSLQDNPALLKKDPDYLAKLQSLSYVDQMQLLGGNWKVKASSGDYYKRENIPIVKEVPQNLEIICRYWDRASTPESENNPDPDWTSGTLMGKTSNNQYIWVDQKRKRDRPTPILEFIKKTAEEDYKEFGYKYFIALEQDPGSAGVSEIEWLTRELAGYPIKIFKASKDKITRQKPLSSQVGIRNVLMLEGSWNEELLEELEAFPEGAHDDQVDTSGGAFLAVSLNQVSNPKEIKASGKLQDFSKYR